MRKILGKIKTIYIVILLLLLILLKLNTIARDISYMDTSVDLSTVEDRLQEIQSGIQDINWNGVKIR